MRPATYRASSVENVIELSDIDRAVAFEASRGSLGYGFMISSSCGVSVLCLGRIAILLVLINSYVKRNGADAVPDDQRYRERRREFSLSLTSRRRLGQEALGCLPPLEQCRGGRAAPFCFMR